MYMLSCRLFHHPICREIKHCLLSFEGYGWLFLTRNARDVSMNTKDTMSDTINKEKNCKTTNDKMRARQNVPICN